MKEALEIRNIVAHNPVAFGADPNNLDSPHTIGIMNLKPKDQNLLGEIISLEEIQGNIDRTMKIGKELHENLPILKLKIEKK